MQTRIRLKEKLEELRRERGLTLEQLEEQTQIPKSNLQRYEDEDDKTNVNYKDLAALAVFYNVSLDYLFGVTDNLQHRHIEVDKLRLTDEAIEVLVSGKLNNRLMCEIIAHPDFPELLSALEVYIDRKFSANIEIMNVAYQKGLDELKDKGLLPEKRDIDIAAIRESIMDGDDYLRFRLTQRFEKLALDLYDSHEKEALSEIGKGYVNEYIKQAGMYLKTYEETDDKPEATYQLLMEQLRIDAKKVLPHEKEVMLRFLSRSKATGRLLRRK